MANSQNLSSDVAKANQDLEKFNNGLLQTINLQKEITRKIGSDLLSKVGAFKRLSEGLEGIYKGLESSSGAYKKNLLDSTQELRKQYGLVGEISNLASKSKGFNISTSSAKNDESERGDKKKFKNPLSLTLKNIDVNDQIELEKVIFHMSQGGLAGKGFTLDQRKDISAEHRASIYSSLSRHGKSLKDVITVDDILINSGQEDLSTKEGRDKLTTQRNIALKFQKATNGSAEDAANGAAFFVTQNWSSLEGGLQDIQTLSNTFHISYTSLLEQMKLNAEDMKLSGYKGKDGEKSFLALEATANQAGYDKSAVGNYTKTIRSDDFDRKMTEKYKNKLGSQKYSEYINKYRETHKDSSLPDAYKAFIAEVAIDKNQKNPELKKLYQQHMDVFTNPKSTVEEQENAKNELQNYKNNLIAKEGASNFDNNAYGASAQDGANAHFSSKFDQAKKNLYDKELGKEIEYKLVLQEQGYTFNAYDQNNAQNEITKRNIYDAGSPAAGNIYGVLADLKKEYPKLAMLASFVDVDTTSLVSGAVVGATAMKGGKIARGASAVGGAAVRGVGAIGAAAMGGAAPAVGVIGAAVGGYWIGTKINDQIEKSKYAVEFNDLVGGALVRGAALLGDKTAQETVAYNTKNQAGFTDHNQVLDNITSQSINNQSSLEVLGQQTKLLEENKQIFCNGFAGVINAIQCAKPITIVSPEYKPNSLIPEIKENRHGATT